MHILLTRPILSVEATKTKLVALGHTVECAPVLEIVALPQQISQHANSIAVFTSHNAVRALEEISPGWLSGFAGHVFAVGEKTAKAVTNAGFSNVQVGGGDVAGLTEFIAITMGQERPQVFFPRGKHVKGELASKLNEYGFEVVSQILYEARPAKSLPESVISGLKGGKFDRVLFYSARTATIFIGLAQNAKIDRLDKVVAVALSAAIADDLKGINWADIKIADEKTETSLISAL